MSIKDRQLVMIKKVYGRYTMIFRVRAFFTVYMRYPPLLPSRIILVVAAEQQCKKRGWINYHL